MVALQTLAQFTVVTAPPFTLIVADCVDAETYAGRLAALCFGGMTI